MDTVGRTNMTARCLPAWYIRYKEIILNGEVSFFYLNASSTSLHCSLQGFNHWICLSAGFEIVRHVVPRQNMCCMLRCKVDVLRFWSNYVLGTMGNVCTVFLAILSIPLHWNFLHPGSF